MKVLKIHLDMQSFKKFILHQHFLCKMTIGYTPAKQESTQKKEIWAQETRFNLIKTTKKSQNYRLVLYQIRTGERDL